MRTDLTPVLMMVPYFAPQSHAAMFRAHKLAKYLPEYGYKPIVVTTDTNYLYNDDPGLLAELPPEVEIHRARYVEPTLRGLRMALGGADRRFVTLKNAAKISVGGIEAGSPSRKASSGLSLGSMAARLFGDWPDRYWTWSGPAERLAQKLIRQHEIRLLYTSANPVSFLRAAKRLRENNDIAWVFDSRDPLGYGRKHTAVHFLAREIEHRLLKSALAKADHVSGLANAYGQIFFDLYGLPEERWSFIPTGLDEDYIQNLPPSTKGRDLLHVGEVMADQSPHCFVTFEAMLQAGGADAPFDRLVFVGRREINEPIIRRMTSNLPLVRERFVFLDHRPQAEVYELMRNARACLLVPGPSRYWWTNFAKLVDYIGLGVPVIAHVPPISEARHELEKTGTAFFLTADAAADSDGLADWLRSDKLPADTAHSARYTARRQVEDFAALFGRFLKDR